MEEILVNQVLYIRSDTMGRVEVVEVEHRYVSATNGINARMMKIMKLAPGGLKLTKTLPAPFQIICRTGMNVQGSIRMASI